MNAEEIIVTYFRLSEKERREKADGGSLAAFLQKRVFASGYAHLAVLNDDGTVTALGDNSKGQCDVSAWSDIVKVAAGDFHTVALRRDGTVVAAGDNTYGQCDVGGWTDIADIFVEKALTVGVKTDGGVVVTSSKAVKEQPSSKAAAPTAPIAAVPDATAPMDASQFEYHIKRGKARIIRYLGNEDKIIIPETIRQTPVCIIKSSAFRGKDMTEIILPRQLEVIETGAFQQCANLKQIKLPDSVATISDYAFSSCTALETVYLPRGLRNLGMYAFDKCPNLKQVIISRSAYAAVYNTVKDCFREPELIPIPD